jgi:ATP-dependent helicase/DNAse subunit B
MPADKYTAVWVSHSSLGDFLKCPRLYYLHNVYKDPKTGRKINVVSPALSLGQAVHNTLEPLRNIAVAERFTRDLLADYDVAWRQISGKVGGFKSEEEEKVVKARGEAMIQRVVANPGPLKNKTVRLKPSHNDMPPNFYLSEEDNIILCGLVDWLEYVEATDSIKILDFKTGKREESEDSLQLPIYLLLLNELQKRPVTGAAYWYLERDDAPIDMELPDIAEARERVLSLAKQVKAAREARAYECPRGAGGCYACKPFEAILRGEAEYVGVGGYGQDMYLV